MPSILPNNNTGLYNTTGNTGPVIFNEYGNANVANYLPTYSGNISSANIGLSGIFTNNYYYANGAPVSFAGTYSNANVAAFLPVYSGNIAGGNITITTAVTAGGNITGAYILGNGSQLTGLPAQYGNANVAAFLPTYTGNLAGGNLTITGVIAGNGSGLTAVPGANVSGTVANAAYATAAGTATSATTAGTVTTNAQPNITSVGTMVSLTATGNVTGGNLVTLGNVSGAYILGNGSQLTGLPESYSNANVASFLTSYTGNLSAGNISVSEDIVVAGDVTAGVFYGTFSGNISGNLVVPGSNTWVLYNNDGNAGSDSNFRFDSATDTLIVNGVGNIVAINATDITATGNISGGNVVTAVVRASNSAGLALKNAGGTTQASLGAGGGDNFAINVSTNLNGTNAQIDISPTGTGHVHIKPSGTGAVEIAPVNPGTINNMVIGNATPLAANFTTVGTTGNITAAGNVTGGNVLATGQVIASGDVRSGSGQSVWAGTVEIENDSVSPAAIKIKGSTDVIGGFAAQSVTVATGNVYGANLVSGGRIDATGNITGAYIIGNGSLLTNITGANVAGTVANAAYATNAGSAATATHAITANTVTDAAQANITSVGTLTSLSVSGNVAGGNISTVGQITATGNITSSGNVQGAYLIGNAAFVTGLDTFSTISANGTSIVATGPSTLTLTPGTDILITGNAGTDTVTITNGYGNTKVNSYVTNNILPNYGGNLIPGNLQVQSQFTVMGNTFYVGQPGPGGVGQWGPWNSLAYIVLDANNVAIGNGAGSNQQDRSISIGFEAGQQSDEDSVAIGSQAGKSDQRNRAVAIGALSGRTTQGNNAVAIGYAASQSQGDGAVAVGSQAGESNQGAAAVAIGTNPAATNQGSQAIAIGQFTGYDTQGIQSIAVGYNAGYRDQKAGAIAIGVAAGYYNQQPGAIAIGAGAGNNFQAANSIVISATSNSAVTLDAANSGLYINPVRNDAANVAQTVYYNTSTKELTYAASVSPGVTSPGGSNTQIQYNNAGSFGGAAVFSFNNATGNVTAGNIVIQANTTSNGAAQNIYTNSNQYFGNTATSPVLGRMLFGSGLSTSVGGSGDFSNNVDVFSGMRGSRMVLADRFQKTDNGLRSAGFTGTQMVDISGNIGAANNNSRIQGISSDLCVGGGNMVNTNPTAIRNFGSIISIGTNGNATVGNAAVAAMTGYQSYIEVRPNSTATNALFYGLSVTNSTGNATAWTNAYGISPTVGGNAAVVNFSLVHMQNANGNGWGVSNTVPPTNYYFLNNTDIRSESIVGPIRQYQDKTYLEATGSGTVAVDWDNGTSQVINLTGDMTLTFQDPTVGTTNQRLIHTVTLVIYQDATGRTVTLPAASTTYRYAGGTSTVGTTASSVTMITISAIRVSGATQYLITVSPEFTG